MRPTFSLKTFLMSVALLGSGLGAFSLWKQQVVERCERHARAMKILGLQSTASAPGSGASKESLYEHLVRRWIHAGAFETRDRICAPKSFWTRDRLDLLKDVNGLDNITCSFDRFTRDDAQALCAIPALAELQLRFKEAEEGAAALLVNKLTLKSLSIDGNPGTNFFPGLRGHPQLTQLRLDRATLTSDDVQVIATLPRLTQFTLGTTLDSELARPLFLSQVKLLVLKISDCDAPMLAGLRGSPIEKLYLSSRVYRPGVLAAVAEAPRLKELTLQGELTLAEDDFERLSRCTQLERLELPSIWLTPQRWKIVTALPKLRWLVAQSSDEAQGCITAFLDSHPDRRFNSH